MKRCRTGRSVWRRAGDLERVLVSFDDSFNFNIQRSTNIGLIFGGGNLQQFRRKYGLVG